MTAIAIVGHPLRTVVIGDLLMSSGVSRNAGFIIPLRGSIDPVFPLGSSFAPNGLRQKLFPFSRNGMLCYAGSMLHARALARELHARFSGELADPDEVSAVLARMDAEIAREIEFVVLVSEQGRVVALRDASKPDGGERFLTLGSGSAELEARIGFLLDSFLAQRRVEPPSHVDIWLDATCLHSSLVRIELGTDSLLLRYAGGGYEFAVSNPNEMGKLTDFSHFFLDCFVDEQKRLFVGNAQLYHQHYSGEDLVIRSARLAHQRADDSFRAADHSTISVPPLLRLNSSIEQPHTPFGRSRVRVLHLSVFDEPSGTLLGAIPRFSYLNDDPDTPEYSVANDGRAVTVRMDKARILSEIGEFMRQRKQAQDRPG